MEFEESKHKEEELTFQVGNYSSLGATHNTYLQEHLPRVSAGIGSSNPCNPERRRSSDRKWMDAWMDGYLK